MPQVCTAWEASVCSASFPDELEVAGCTQTSWHITMSKKGKAGVLMLGDSMLL